MMERTRDESAESSEGSAVLQGDMLRSVRQRRAKTARLVASETQHSRSNTVSVRVTNGLSAEFMAERRTVRNGTYDNTDNTIRLFI